mmetsp:Transcript_133033/g.315320  ORF Transcript_133033/g.315320 Transcript_133033/m.315320 type:complete len:89 (+) Transcript_133033:250-516(+)
MPWMPLTQRFRLCSWQRRSAGAYHMILQREITQLLHVRQAVMKTEKANCVQLDGQMYRMTPKASFVVPGSATEPVLLSLARLLQWKEC